MRRFILVFAFVLLDRSAAFAEATPGSLELSLKAGGHFPQLTNSLGTNFDGVLKVGYGVALEKRLQLFADLGYSQPSHTTSNTDPRLGAAGADYQSTIRVRDLSTTLGAQYFIPIHAPLFLPYAGAGVQFHFIRSVVQGSGGAAFGRNDETNTRIGGLVFGGTCVKLGPGVLIGELRFGYAAIADKVTGSSNIGSLSVLAGYGFML